MSLRIFLHGLEGSNLGTKSVFFRDRYPDMIIPNFTGNLWERMKDLGEILSGRSGISLVGSSFGGLMAALFAMENESRVDRLILLAPALNLAGFSTCQQRDISVPVRVYHGRNDEVIPLNAVERVARKSFLNLSFHAVDDDHSLHKTFKSIDWDTLLLP